MPAITTRNGTETFPRQAPLERSTMSSWDDEAFVAAVEKTGRKKIVPAGLWTETCVALPTVQAIHDGYEVYVVEDCSGLILHNGRITTLDPARAEGSTGETT